MLYLAQFRYIYNIQSNLEDYHNNKDIWPYFNYFNYFIFFPFVLVRPVENESQ